MVKKDVNKTEKVNKEKNEENKKTSEKKKLKEGIRGIVRVCETNIDGTKKLSQAILNIKGIGYTLCFSIPKVAGLDSNKLLGELTEEEVKKLEDVIRIPIKFKIPEFMVNRRNDRTTGESKHIVESEILLTKKSDIDVLKKIRSYKGIRHERGLPVRGQRTRSSFRKGGSVGVSKKKEKPAAKKNSKLGV